MRAGGGLLILLVAAQAVLCLSDADPTSTREVLLKKFRNIKTDRYLGDKVAIIHDGAACLRTYVKAPLVLSLKGFAPVPYLPSQHSDCESIVQIAEKLTGGTNHILFIGTKHCAAAGNKRSAHIVVRESQSGQTFELYRGRNLVKDDYTCPYKALSDAAESFIPDAVADEMPGSNRPVPVGSVGLTTDDITVYALFGVAFAIVFALVLLVVYKCPNASPVVQEY